MVGCYIPHQITPWFLLFDHLGGARPGVWTMVPELGDQCRVVAGSVSAHFPLSCSCRHTSHQSTCCLLYNSPITSPVSSPLSFVGLPPLAPPSPIISICCHIYRGLYTYHITSVVSVQNTPGKSVLCWPHVTCNHMATCIYIIFLYSPAAQIVFTVCKIPKYPQSLE